MAGGRPNPLDNAPPFRAGVTPTEEALLRALNSRRVQLGWSARELDRMIGHSVDLTTIILRGCNSKTSTIFYCLEALGLEIVVRPKAKGTRLQRAIAARKKAALQSADSPEGVSGE